MLSVSNLVSAFTSASALSSCNKGAIYLAWGTTLRTAYPAFLSSASISSFSPPNTQVSGAATVTVLGANFQCSDLSPSAYISGQPCATTAWTTTTQLVCAAPAPVLVGAGREAWVQVFTNTASRGFTFDGMSFAAWNRFRSVPRRKLSTACPTAVYRSSGGERPRTGERRSERRRHRHDRRAELRRCRPNRDGLADRG